MWDLRRRSLSVALAFAYAAWGGLARADGPEKAPAADTLDSARVLDNEGARAYTEGRFADAARLFSEAFDAGGPAFELWNVARCELKLDRPEEAEATLVRYLAIAELPPKDRAQAEAQLAELRNRRSRVVVTTQPAGATVVLDGEPVDERTPVSFDVAAGSHEIEIRRDGASTVTHRIEARLGRAILLTERGGEERRGPAPDPYGRSTGTSVIARALFLVGFPRYGGVGGAAHVGGLLRAGVVFPASSRFALGAGLSGTITRAVWQNTAAPSPLPGGCELGGELSAIASSAFLEANGALQITRALTFAPHVGVGVAALSSTSTGGELFAPSCAASYGAQPAMLLSPDLELALGVARFVVSPLSLQLHPAFDGAEAAAGGAWLRFSMGLGVGVDL